VDTTPKQTWTRPSVTPLTDPGSRSDAPDVNTRNGVSGVNSAPTN
jgi:hypothetical protein